MQTHIIHPIIMAGGMGTRLWPVSRQSRPKQFQPIVSQHSMFQETALRVSGETKGISFAPPRIIGGADFADLMAEDLRAIGLQPDEIILEPFGRNTAAVAAMAALAFSDPDALILLLPSDHHMTDPDAFRDAVAQAAPIAADGKITTFGIAAREPHTGYGYIRQGEIISGQIYGFDAFVEKPDLETARRYIAAGSYSWNAGIFLFSARAMLAELEICAPDILAGCSAALKTARRDGFYTYLNAEAFEPVRSDSIDYAVMEHTQNGAVLAPLECGWDDIGSWSAVADLSADNPDDPQIIQIATDGCHIRSDGDSLIAAIGVKDLIIRVHDGAILVAHKDHAQSVKSVVEALKSTNRTQYL